jgi:hypothetical protein
VTSQTSLLAKLTGLLTMFRNHKVTQNFSKPASKEWEEKKGKISNEDSYLVLRTPIGKL